MGSSAKRKKEKKKDFQKAKLKVGKTKPKASNFTDTSFKAKSIVLTHQSLSTTAPTPSALFAHHLSLLTHRSDTQRRDSLAHLTHALTAASTAQPTVVLLPALQPLILDPSRAVRTHLLALLQTLHRHHPTDIPPHADRLLLYARAGITHLAPDIRLSALDVLEWLLAAAGPAAVGCAGGWARTLGCFAGLLGWGRAGDGAESGTGAGAATAASLSLGRAAAAATTGDARVRVRLLVVLAALLRTGLAPEDDETDGGEGARGSCFPLRDVELHMVSTRSRPLAHLNLFGAPRDEEAEMYEDRGDRQRYFDDRFRALVAAGTEQARKQGGEVGRAAGLVKKAVDEGMRDYRS